MSTRVMKIFVMSDSKTVGENLKKVLSDYDEYQLNFIPTVYNMFDVMKLDPDVIVDPEQGDVVKCHEWAAA